MEKSTVSFWSSSPESSNSSPPQFNPQTSFGNVDSINEFTPTPLAYPTYNPYTSYHPTRQFYTYQYGPVWIPVYKPAPSIDSKTSFEKSATTAKEFVPGDVFATSVEEYVPDSLLKFKAKIRTGDFEFKPAHESTPEKEGTQPTTVSPSSNDEIPNINLELADILEDLYHEQEVQHNASEDQWEEWAPDQKQEVTESFEETKTPQTRAKLEKDWYLTTREYNEAEEDIGPPIQIESLIPTIVYSLEDLYRIGTLALAQEVELEPKIQYFRDRKLLRIYYVPESRTGNRYNRYRQKTPNKRYIRPEPTQEQKLIQDQARRIRERLKAPQSDRVNAEKKTRGILGKIVPQNFTKLKVQLLDICKESEDYTTDVTNAIYKRACTGTKYTEMYAELCAYLSHCPELYFAISSKKNLFHRTLLIMCEEVFRKVPPDEVETEERMSLRRSALSNMRFLAELYKNQLITNRIAFEIMHTLLDDSKEEDKIEAACEFILNCPEKIRATPQIKLEGILTQLDSIKECVSSRIKFKILDIFDAKKSGWRRNRFESGPSKI